MRYIVEEDEDDGWGPVYASVYLIDSNYNKIEVGTIGGEPEDNTYYRDYSWVVPALNEAFKLGYKEGAQTSS